MNSLTFNHTNYEMIGHVPFPVKRNLSSIDDTEVYEIVEMFTPYHSEDVIKIDRRKLRKGDHVKIEIKAKDKQGNRIKNAKGNLVMLTSDRLFFSSYATGANIDFDTRGVIHYLKSRNFK